MSAKRVLARRFFQLLVKRSFVSAERLLRKIEEFAHSDWDVGYITALKGMLHSARTGEDRDLLLRRIVNEGGSLEALEDEFRLHSLREVRDEFDRGYFAAWADFLEILSKLKQ